MVALGEPAASGTPYPSGASALADSAESTVSMGSARPTTAGPRPAAQGTGTSNIRLSQCWPLAFTQWLGDDISNNTRFLYKAQYSIAHRKPFCYLLIRRDTKNQNGRVDAAMKVFLGWKLALIKT
jgi:hypothetical protein